MWAAVVATALLTTSCSLVGGDDDSGDDEQARGAGDPRVVRDVRGAAEAVRGRERLRPGGQGVRRRRRADQQAGAHQGRPDRRRGVRHRQHLRRRAPSTRACWRRTPRRCPDGADAYELEGDADHDLTPVDTGNVCVNVDDTWFADHGVAEPQTLDDLVEAGVHATSSSPPARPRARPGWPSCWPPIAAYGEDGWQDYWTQLMANGAKLTQGWSDAYEVDFTQGGGGGDRPIVLSYDSSPAFTLDGQGGTTTSALLDTCFRQVEYAGVLAGADEPRGRRGAGRLPAEPAVPGGAARRDVRLPGRRRRRRCRRTGRSSPRSPTTPTPSTRPRSPSTATSGSQQWSDVTSR